MKDLYLQKEFILNKGIDRKAAYCDQHYLKGTIVAFCNV